MSVPQLHHLSFSERRSQRREQVAPHHELSAEDCQINVSPTSANCVPIDIRVIFPVFDAPIVVILMNYVICTRPTNEVDFGEDEAMVSLPTSGGGRTGYLLVLTFPC